MPHSAPAWQPALQSKMDHLGALLKHRNRERKTMITLLETLVKENEKLRGEVKELEKVQTGLCQERTSLQTTVVQYKEMLECVEVRIQDVRNQIDQFRG